MEALPAHADGVADKGEKDAAGVQVSRCCLYVFSLFSILIKYSGYTQGSPNLQNSQLQNFKKFLTLDIPDCTRHGTYTVTWNLKVPLEYISCVSNKLHVSGINGSWKTNFSLSPVCPGACYKAIVQT